jgi:trans-aconitate 2-methyltransferase
MAASWSPDRYLQFADHRTRPSIDLLAAMPNREAERVVDIGCGPGNSTELLVSRFAGAEVSGMDSSPEMIAAARRRLPGVPFTVARIEDWEPAEAMDVIFGNAVLQWLPEHGRLLPRLVDFLRPGGSLAVQMPDNLDEPSHAAMREAAADTRWAGRLAGAEGEKSAIQTPQAYYAMLKPICRRVDVWRTTYQHPLNGVEGIVEWFRSTGLMPYLSRLAPDQQEDYLDLYRKALAAHYPLLGDGTTLLAIPRLFIVATR